MAPRKCLRCNVDFQELGVKRFHEGPKLGFFGDIGELFVRQESFLVCRCNSCGEIAFFTPFFDEKVRESLIFSQQEAQRKQEALKAIAEKYGEIKTHPRFKDFLKGEPARKFFSHEDQMFEFSSWMESQDRSV